MPLFNYCRLSKSILFSKKKPRRVVNPPGVVEIISDVLLSCRYFTLSLAFVNTLFCTYFYIMRQEKLINKLNVLPPISVGN